MKTKTNKRTIQELVPWIEQQATFSLDLSGIDMSEPYNYEEGKLSNAIDDDDDDYDDAMTSWSVTFCACTCCMGA